MKSNKSAIYWGLGGTIVIIVAVLAWWLWWSYTPYDESDPQVQEQLAMIENLREDIKNNKAFVSAYVQIGHIYEELGDNRRALSTYNQLARLRPQSSPPFVALGRYYSSQRRYNVAEKNLLKARDNDPDNVSIYQDLSLLYTYSLTGNSDKFEALILNASSQYPNVKSNLIHLLAFYFRDIGDKDNARVYLNQLFELVPEQSATWQQALDELDER